MSSSHPPLRRFLYRFACFGVIQLAIAGVVFWLGALTESASYYGAFQDKIARLDSIDEPRLLLIGGSNVAFGIDSRKLERELDLQTVNLGLHASLGLDYQLDIVRRHGRAGDTVLLIAEYELFDMAKQAGDPRFIADLIEEVPSANRYFEVSSWASWRHFFDHDALPAARQFIRRAYGFLRNPNKTSEPDRVYRRSGFNKYGDMIAHHGQHAGQLKDLDPLNGIDSADVDATIEKLNNFDRSCRQEGICVLMTYPPMPESRFKQSETVIRFIENSLAERLTIPLLNPPDDFVYPIGYFYDTSYHLGKRGTEIRTKQLSEVLNRQLLQSNPL